MISLTDDGKHTFLVWWSYEVIYMFLPMSDWRFWQVVSTIFSFDDDTDLLRVLEETSYESLKILFLRLVVVEQQRTQEISLEIWAAQIWRGLEVNRSTRPAVQRRLISAVPMRIWVSISMTKIKRTSVTRLERRLVQGVWRKKKARKGQRKLWLKMEKRLMRMTLWLTISNSLDREADKVPGDR